jgi:hypothetical protein
MENRKESPWQRPLRHILQSVALFGCCLCKEEMKTYVEVMPSALAFAKLSLVILSSEVFTAVTMKNAVFWNIKSQFVSHMKHIRSPLQRPAS